MKIVCERHTTSKLTSYDDLAGMSTFGFRGEALASISHVSKLTIVSMVRDSPCAYKAAYRDGRVAPIRLGAKALVRPSAGVPGTQITAEDLFYNMPTRRAAMRSPSDEYQRVLDVVTRYAVHFGPEGRSFTCRRGTGAPPDLHTGSVAGRKRQEAIGLAYGHALARELVSFQASQGVGAEMGVVMEQEESAETAGDSASSCPGSGARITQGSERATHPAGGLSLPPTRTAVPPSLPETESAGGSTASGNGTVTGTGREGRSSSGTGREGGSSSTSNTPSVAGAESGTGGGLFSETACFRLKGLCSSASYSMKRGMFILFVNHRLVESPSLKRACTQPFAHCLPKGSHPFVYLEVELPPSHVDVNVHPAKRHVALLHEDAVAAAATEAIEAALEGANRSRTFYTQALLPGGTTAVAGAGLRAGSTSAG